MRKTVIIFAAAASLAAGAFLLSREVPTKPVRFTTTDGTVVEVLKVTSGPKHRFRYDYRWQDMLGQALPAPLRARLRSHILEYPATIAHSLIVWLRSEATPAQHSGTTYQDNWSSSDSGSWSRFSTA